MNIDPLVGKGLTTADVSDAWKDKILRYLRENPGALENASDAVRGTVAQWTKEQGARRVAWQKSQIHNGRIQQTEVHQADFDLDPVVKRSLEARVGAMVERLRLLDPALQEALLEKIAGEYWKAGMPVRGEDLKVLAAHYLNQAQPVANRAQRRAATRATRTKST